MDTQEKTTGDTEQAFPGTDDTRTVEEVDAQIKETNAEQVVTAFEVVEELETKLAELGGYAVSVLQPTINKLREVL